MSLQLDVGSLITAVRLRGEIRGYGFDEGINKATKDVALRSIAFTPAVPASVISAQLRTQIATRFATKTGRRLKNTKAIYQASDFIDADGNARGGLLIMLARLRKAGKLKSVSGAEIRQMALKMANGRVRSGSYVRAGFLAAAKPFGGGNGSGDAHLYRAPGGGVLATPEHLLAEIHNDTTVAHWKGNAAAYQAMVRGLQKGVDAVEKDLLVYIDRKLRQGGFA